MNKIEYCFLTQAADGRTCMPFLRTTYKYCFLNTQEGPENERFSIQNCRVNQWWWQSEWPSNFLSIYSVLRILFKSCVSRDVAVRSPLAIEMLGVKTGISCASVVQIILASLYKREAWERKQSPRAVSPRHLGEKCTSPATLQSMTISPIFCFFLGRWQSCRCCFIASSHTWLKLCKTVQEIAKKWQNVTCRSRQKKTAPGVRSRYFRCSHLHSWILNDVYKGTAPGVRILIQSTFMNIKPLLRVFGCSSYIHASTFMYKIELFYKLNIIVPVESQYKPTVSAPK